MKEDIGRFTDRKAQIIVVAPHEAEKVRSYWKRENLPFTAIPDPDGVLGKRYSQEWSLFKLGRMPALFVIDRNGTVAYAQYAGSMADIPDTDTLIRVLEGLA